MRRRYFEQEDEILVDKVSQQGRAANPPREKHIKAPKELKIPLRARKKAKLRDALLSTSFRLFRQKGYAQTTLEEISEKCDVTVQTLLRYFGSKEDLLFANQEILSDRFRQGLAIAIENKAVLDYWAGFLHQFANRLVVDQEVRQAYSIIASAPSLVGRLFAIARQYELLLEQALSEEIGLNAGEDLHSTLLAHLIAIGPLEPAMRALSQSDPLAASMICDQIVQYARDNFKRPPQTARKNTSTGKRSQRSASRALAL
jgi:AcrR family transcriptional regulator